MKTVDAWKALLRRELRSAMRDKDRTALAAIRETLAAIDNAEAQPIDIGQVDAEGAFAGSVQGLGGAEVPRRELAPAAVQAIVESEIRERLDAAAGYKRLGRREKAEALTRQAGLLSQLMSSQGEASG